MSTTDKVERIKYYPSPLSTIDLQILLRPSLFVLGVSSFFCRLSRIVWMEEGRAIGRKMIEL